MQISNETAVLFFQVIAFNPGYEIDYQEDFDETLPEEAIHVIEAYLVQILNARGMPKISSQTKSSGWPSRIVSSTLQSNLQPWDSSLHRLKERQVQFENDFYVNSGFNPSFAIEPRGRC